MIGPVTYLDGNKLKRARVRQGLTQRELTSRSRVAQSTIVALERRGRNESFHPSTLRKLSDALGIPPDDLLED
jgi:transcriptional regulator with XRE-family HTH domain